MKKGIYIEYKGYKLKQTFYNYHYMIFDKNDELVLHASYRKPLNEETAKEIIDNYIILLEVI